MKEIPLGGKSTGVALVDDEDYERISQFLWHESRNGFNRYARSADGKGQGTALKMHRVVLGLQAGDPMVDHIDGNGLNNQKANLRLVSPRENQWNSRRRGNGRKGVCRATRRGYWRARILVNGKRIHLGTFNSEEEAAAAYAEAAKLHFGEFARADGPDQVIETKH